MDKILTIRKDYGKGEYALIQELNSECHGWWISFNADDSKKWERFYLYGKKNGPEREWYKNGVLMHERSFKDDLLNGPWKTFYENGQLKNDAREGNNCTYEWKNGTKAICMFQNNFPVKGKLIMPDNQSFDFDAHERK